MVTIEGRRWLCRYRQMFFATPEQVLEILDSIAPFDLVRVRQSTSFLQSHPTLIHRSIYRTSIIDLTTEISVLYRTLHTLCRRGIRRAENMRESIHIRTNDELAHQHLFDMHNRFVVLKGHTKPLTTRRFRELLPNSDVFVIYFNKRPLCGHLMIRDEGRKRVRLHLSASTRLEGEGEAKLCGSLNRYLHWHELQTYKDTGIDTFDFGGIGDGTSSMASFKLSFGGTCVQEFNYLLGGTLVRAGLAVRHFVTPL
jgi:hypothetical protein